jgi:hypothetical protein
VEAFVVSEGYSYSDFLLVVLEERSKVSVPYSNFLEEAYSEIQEEAYSEVQEEHPVVLQGHSLKNKLNS